MIFCLFAFCVSAQQEDHHLTFSAGAGVTQPVGQIDRRLDTGWNVQVSGGYLFTRNIGATLDFQYNGMGLTNGYLQQVAVPNGTGRIWSVTLNPVYRFRPRGPLGFYVTAGGGFYQRTVEFTQPTTAP